MKMAVLRRGFENGERDGWWWWRREKGGFRVLERERSSISILTLLYEFRKTGGRE